MSYAFAIISLRLFAAATQIFRRRFLRFRCCHYAALFHAAAIIDVFAATPLIFSPIRCLIFSLIDTPRFRFSMLSFFFTPLLMPSLHTPGCFLSSPLPPLLLFSLPRDYYGFRC